MHNFINFYIFENIFVAKNNKSYEFIIIFGMSTDTDDIMGLFENISSSNNFSLLNQEKTYKGKFQKALQTIPCREYQKYHKYLCQLKS